MAESYLKRLASKWDKGLYKDLHQEMSFEEYLAMVAENPQIVRTAYQRMYDMIISKGSHTMERNRKRLTHYNFFDDHEIAVFGLEESLDKLVTHFKGAAGGYGSEKRVLLLHGPVGSSKSTICRRLKRGLEEYSKTPEGAWYTYKWIDLPTGSGGIYTHDVDDCPMHEEPLKLIPLEIRKEFLKTLNVKLRDMQPEKTKNTIYTLQCDGELNPRSKKFMADLMERCDGDWESVLNKHIRVVRKVFSESDRMGIGTFQPKDEKNQDSTELNGDIDFSKIPHFGKDSDPRAFSFDGEFCVGNRGMVEFIEMLKLAPEFLYDLLGASQERQIKPKKFSQVAIDEVIMGHTNIAEYDKLQANPYMVALKDRTVKIDIGYLLKWSDEIKVLSQDYGPEKVRQHVAPHTIEIAALWAILTRLEECRDKDVDPVSKAKLYNGDMLQGHNEDSVKELMDKAQNEGMRGVSCRYIQDKISNCLSSNHEYINPFMVMNEIREGLEHHSLITDKEDLAKYVACWDLAIKELDEILKEEVSKALTGDENAVIRLCANYIDNLMAYIKKNKIRNPITGRDEPPNERLMRSIEEQIGIPEQGVDDFRRMIAAFIGECHHEGKQFRWDSNHQLKKALEKKLFEDTKHHIKLSALNANGATVVDPDLQEKIDAIKTRLVKQYGYIEKSASDVLEYVGSLFQVGSLATDD